MQTDLGSGFTQFDSGYAWGTVAPPLEWCDYDCGGSNANNLEMVMDATITINPGTRDIMGHASATLTGFGSDSQSPEFDLTLDVTMSGATSLSPYQQDWFSIEEDVMGVADQPGVYVITADATASLVDPFGDGWLASGHASDSTVFNGAGGPSGGQCSGPVITGVQIYPGPNTLPQPTSGLRAGSSGTLQVSAACLNDSAQLSIDGLGINLSGITLASGAIQAQYSVDQNEPSESRILNVTTSAGTAATPIQIVASSPYIQSISPTDWPAGQTTSITITGAGFGGAGGPGASQGAVAFGSGYATNWNLTSWSDGRITGTVNPDSRDPGETVTVSVTGGSYGSGFLHNAGDGVASPTAEAQVVGGAQCTSVQIVEQTISPGTLPIRNPATIRQGYAPVFEVTKTPTYCGVQWNVTGSGAIVGSANSTLVTVNGNSIGTAYLQATGAGGLSAITTVPVRLQQTLPLSVVIVRDDSGNNAAVTEEYALRDIAQANLAWQQASRQFTYNGPPRYINSSMYLNPTSDAQKEAVTRQLPNTGTFTVYYAATCTGPNELGHTFPTGMVVCRKNFINYDFPEALNTTLAHELGHAQSLCHVFGPLLNLMYGGTLDYSVLEADITISQANSLTNTPTVCKP